MMNSTDPRDERADQSGEADRTAPAGPADAFHAVREPRLVHSVVRQIVDKIVGGQFPPGSQLPTEPQLVGQFGVSRTVIREAIKMLEEKALVEVRHGRGAFVTPRHRWNMLDADVLAAETDPGAISRMLAELMAARIALESDMAATAATTITNEQLARMSALLNAMREVVDQPELYMEHDIAFHQQVVEAADNRIVIAIIGSIQAALRKIRRELNQIPSGPHKAQEFHEELYRRLAARDADGARETMRAHLTWSLTAWQRLDSKATRRKSGRGMVA